MENNMFKSFPIYILLGIVVLSSLLLFAALNRIIKKKATTGIIIFILTTVFLTLFFTFGEKTYFGRIIIWGIPTPFHHENQYNILIKKSSNSNPLQVGMNKYLSDPSTLLYKQGEVKIHVKDLDRFLTENQTMSFIVLKNGKIVLERYANGLQKGKLVRVQSVTKSVLSALVGIALTEGHLQLDDSISKYVHEFKGTKHEKITIEHLLTMTSGIKFSDSQISPFSDAAKVYFGTDTYKLLMDTEIVYPPNKVFHYNDYNTELMGLILKRATGKSVSDYLQEKIWQPLGMEYNALWSADSESNKFEKCLGGINAAPMDMARFGQLFLQMGKWNGKQIIPEDWIRKSTRPDQRDNPIIINMNYLGVD